VTLKERRPRAAWLLVAPTALLLLAVSIYPLIYSLRLSFFKWELTAAVPPAFVGLENYVRILSDDTRFWSSLSKSFYLVAAGVIVELVLGIALASLVTRTGTWRAVITALLLIPVMIAPVVVATQGIVIYNVQWGPLNYLLSLIGIDGPVWLGDRNIALQTILLTDVWQWTPFVIVIMAAGMQSLPVDVFEAAEVDGGSGWQIFRNITLPLIQPLIVVTALIRSMDIFKTFDYVYVLTGGGPGSSTETLSFYNFLQGLEFFSFGYASAMSYIQLIIISVFASVLIRHMRKGLV
jgi:multiple sugar transport system permease protein